jgi:Domain of unknown function (DUF4190)
VNAGEEPLADASTGGQQTPPPPPGEVSVAPGWYSVDQQTNTQAYWDGHTWAKSRHWRGTGWVEDSAEPVPAGASVYSSSYAALTRPPRSQASATAPPSPPMGGYPPAPGQLHPAAQTTNGLAIASLVLSILGVFGIGSLLGIIFGYKARREIRASRGHQSGDGMALAGIIIGFVTLVVFALVLAFWIAAFASIRSAVDSAASPRAQVVAQCQADVKSVDVALEAYHAETGSLPVPTAAWSAGSYASNYGPLTTGAQGDTFLAAAPATSNYVVEYDSAGDVWVGPPNSFEQSYTPNQDQGVNAEACQSAVPG